MHQHFAGKMEDLDCLNTFSINHKPEDYEHLCLTKIQCSSILFDWIKEVIILLKLERRITKLKNGRRVINGPML